MFNEEISNGNNWHFHLLPGVTDAVYEFCNHFPKWLTEAKDQYGDEYLADIYIDYGVVTIFVVSKGKTIKISYTGIGSARYWYEGKTYLQEFAEDKRSFLKVIWDEFGFRVDHPMARLK